MLAGLNAPPSAAGYVLVLTGRKTALTKASWRFLRAAIKWWIALTISIAEAEHFARLFAAAHLAVKKARKHPKRLPKPLLTALLETLQSRPYGRNKAIAADMLIAGTATGLRPCEWSRARLTGDTLVVTNAKYRPGVSGNGPVRSLVLQQDVITADQRGAINRVLAALRGSQWEKIGGNIRRAFNTAKERLKTARRITRMEHRTRLYEARHQFSADAKMTLDYLGGEVAGAMGHRAAMTAHTAYGNRREARGTLPVKPTVDSVERVEPKSLQKLAQSLAKASSHVRGVQLRDVASNASQLPQKRRVSGPVNSSRPAGSNG